MAYRALYRAYRPQSFEDVAGQRHVTQTLKNAIKENKISHAYLFCGPRGTGKTSIAKILAKAINCEHPELGVPCNQCDSCQAITNGEHPDILEIDAASNNGVDEVRDLIEKVKYAPIRGKYKVYIIDEVHMMSTGAFNALLKTLEEPPSHIVFILATTEPQKVLPTIISRCQRFDFTKISIHDIVEYLDMVLHKEGVTFEKEALELIAQLAEGGMRDSLSILEQCLAYCGKQLRVEDVNQVYGIVSTQHKIDFILQLMRKDMAGVLKDLNKMNESGTDIKRLTFDLVQILKDVIIYKNTKQSELMFVLNDDNVGSITPYLAADECFDYIDILTEAMQKYRETSDAKIYFELACMKICNQVHEAAPAIAAEKSAVPQPVEVIRQPEPAVQKTIEEPVIHDYQKDEPQDEHVSMMEEQLNNDDGVLRQEAPGQTIVPEVKATTTQEKTEVKELKGDIQVEFKDILNILVQADRRVLNAIQQQWPVIKRYLANINTAKWASMLIDSTPVAASVGGLILACEHQPPANNLNYHKNYYGIKGFLKNVLGEEYDYIAVTRNQWTDIRNSYLKLRQVNQLPSPRPIVISHVQENEEPEENNALTEGQKFAYDLFGDLVEIVEE